MPTLLIEHSISDFDTWHEAFGRFAARRKKSGVLRERIMQPVGDPHYVFIDLEFATVEAAQRFQQRPGATRHAGLCAARHPTQVRAFSC